MPNLSLANFADVACLTNSDGCGQHRAVIKGTNKRINKQQRFGRDPQKQFNLGCLSVN